MRRDQLEHAIRTSCQIIEQPEVLVVGSQAILGSFDESQLPAAATMSIEVNILPMAETNEETARLADMIEGVAGEFSTFEALHGFSIDGVDLGTAVLPEGWRDRAAWRCEPDPHAADSVRGDRADLPHCVGAAFLEVDRA